MITIIPNEPIRRQKRRRSSLLFCAVMAIAGISGGLEVKAFGVTQMPTTSSASASQRDLSLHMKQPENLHRSAPQTGRTIHGSKSSDLISRKAALVDSSHLDVNGSSSTRIRDRVNSFLRSKKKKSKIVQEVKDVDSIYSALGEGQKEAVYTAVIFHAPYCRACKASMPLFEELARQYNKRNKKYTKQQKKQQPSWLPRKQPVVKFLSVPVTQHNSKDLQNEFAVTRFPLAHIYDPVDGLVDERPVLRKLFSSFEERLESVVVASESASPLSEVSKNATMA